MRQISCEIAGAQDFELGIARASSLKYDCMVPEGRAKGLVFVIPGFGEDASTEYNQVLRRYLCGRYGLVAVTVAYHCCQARPPLASYQLQLEDLQRLLGEMATRGIPLKLDMGDINRFIADLEKTGIASTIATKLVPANGDYQNFGVMQAIDHILALNHILDSGIDFDTNNIVCFGSSHGAYLAHLVHKFAPNTINTVINVSGYAVCNSNFVGCSPEALYIMGNVTLGCNLVTKWSFTDNYATEFFGPARFAIRNVRHPGHIAEAAAKSIRKCQFRMATSVEDKHSPVAQKTRQCRTLLAHGFDAQLKIVEQRDIDGKMFKSLAHGMEASMNAVFDHYADSVAARPTTLDRKLQTSLDLECYDLMYRIQHSNTAPFFEASCEPFDPE